MLLALDVGNTNITIGVFKRKEIIEERRRTAEYSERLFEYGFLESP